MLEPSNEEYLATQRRRERRADILHQLLLPACDVSVKELVAERWLHVAGNLSEQWFDVEPHNIPTLRVRFWRAEDVAVQETFTRLLKQTDPSATRDFILVTPRGNGWRFFRLLPETGSASWRRPHIALTVDNSIRDSDGCFGKTTTAI
jgi:hypothetical protein